jgi:hypothetical protein
MLQGKKGKLVTQKWLDQKWVKVTQKWLDQKWVKSQSVN